VEQADHVDHESSDDRRGQQNDPHGKQHPGIEASVNHLKDPWNDKIQPGGAEGPGAGAHAGNVPSRS